jgi:hypothetical protein
MTNYLITMFLTLVLGFIFYALVIPIEIQDWRMFAVAMVLVAAFHYGSTFCKRN